MGKIDSFTEDNFFLSNFYIHPLIYNGKEYKSVEHEYQAHKADNEEDHEYIKNLETAGKAKRHGRIVHIRRDWEDIKYDLMLNLLRIKFNDVELFNLLMNTDDDELIEGNDWHDNLWGDCYCDRCKNTIGENLLGEFLVLVREEKKGL